VQALLLASSCCALTDLYRVILYEYPFNERIRSLLRLEYMFDRLLYFSQPGDARLHQVAVATLFDVLEVTDRNDIRSGLLQDIEKHRAALAALCGYPEVEQTALEQMLDEIEHTVSRLTAQGRIGQTLREDEWLNSLRGRIGLPGGATQIDMPSYYAWQMRDEAARCDDLRRWRAPFRPLYEGVCLVLRLLRGTDEPQDFLAHGACYQQMLNGKPYQLARVWVGKDKGVFPEISANKYMIWIRFAAPGQIGKSQKIESDVPFKMALCSA